MLLLELGFVFGSGGCWGVVGEVCTFPSMFYAITISAGFFPTEDFPHVSLFP